MLENLAERTSMLRQPPRERTRRVELHGVETRAHLPRTPGEPHAKRVAKRVCRIGGDDENPPGVASAARRRRTLETFGLGTCGRRRAGGLADAAFPAEKDEPGLGTEGWGLPDPTRCGQCRSSRCRHQ